MSLSLATRAPRRLFALTVATAALGVAGCGEDSGEEEVATVSSEQAITEIAAVRSGLDDSLAAYRNDDAESAEQLAGDAYLEHFELVEGPLEEADAELNEELEELIREELRAAIVDGEPVADVQDLVEEADAGLDEAEQILEQAGA